ncbi:MAG: hypothetical protein ACKVT2_22550 [Saprospiraceae bacterium]
MTIKMLTRTLLGIFALSLGLFACSEEEQLGGEFRGVETAFGFGKAYTYVINDDNGDPLEIGVALDKNAFDNFTSMSGDEDLSLDFPEAAGNTPFKHQYMAFAGHGHEPMGIYDVPHYDFHFYTSPHSERASISPFDTVKAALLPSADYFPQAYFPTPLVPLMGVHWLDGTAPELNGISFTQTFIWGSFDNKVTFLEPMITRQFILDQRNFETDIKQPAKYDQPGKYYPTKQGFSTNQASSERRFFLRGFVKR